MKAYAWPHYVWMVAADWVALAMFGLFLRLLVRPLHRLATRAAAYGGGVAALDKMWGGPGWKPAIWFAFLFFTAFQLAHVPFAVYFGYVLEKRFGLSNHTPASYAWDLFRGTGISVVAMVALALGLYGLARRMRRWWLVLGVVAGLGLLGSEALDPYRGRIYFDQTPLTQQPLRSDLDALLRRAGVPYRDIVVENSSRATKKVDVVCAGDDANRRIILSDELVRNFTEPEILSAVAHEAGHVHESKWPARIASALSVLFLLFVVDRLFQLAASRGWWGVSEPADVRTLPLISLVVFVFTAVAGPVTAAWARERERAADRFAIELTHDPDSFRQLLVRAARLNKIDPDPPQWAVWSGFGHPPIGERIRWAESQKAAGK